MDSQVRAGPDNLGTQAVGNIPMQAPTSLRFVNWSEAGSDRQSERTVPVAIISLDDAHERRRLMKEAGMPPAFVDGYWPARDLRNLDQADFAKYLDLESFDTLVGWTPSPGEIGCSVSHRDALDSISTCGAPLALIFEDDVRPVRSDAFGILATLLEPLYSYAESGAAFFCHLGVRRMARRKAVNLIVRDVSAGKHGHWIIRDSGPECRFYRAHAYILSNAAARRTVAGETPIRVGADHFSRRFRLGYFDRSLFVEPGLFTQDHNIPSYIREGAADADSMAEMDRLSLNDRLRRLLAQNVSL